jgi:hypothetical protein
LQSLASSSPPLREFVRATSRIPHLTAARTAPMAARVWTLGGRHDGCRSAGWTRLRRVSNSARARGRSTVDQIAICRRHCLRIWVWRRKCDRNGRRTPDSRKYTHHTWSVLAVHMPVTNPPTSC